MARDLDRSHTERKGDELTESASAAAGIEDSAWASLGALLHLSHEIRTPLNSILVLSQLLRDGTVGALNSEQQKYVEVIARSGQNLLRLVTDVVDLARLEAGSMEIEPQAIDLQEQLRGIASAWAPLAADKGIEIRVTPSEDLPRVRCDPERLRQVLTNLTGNAIKFTHQGRVVLSTEMADGVVAVHVSDTGIGIADDVRQTLLEEALPSGTARMSRRAGNGLGLAIVVRLVRLMGGDLSVQCLKGEGSRFTFTLPISDGGVSPEASRLSRRHIVNPLRESAPIRESAPARENQRR